VTPARGSEALAVAMAVLAASAAPAPAEVVPGWEHEAAAGGVNLAFTTGDHQELTVRCRNDAVEVVFYVDASTIDPMLVGRLSAVLAVMIDDSDEFQWIQSKLVAEPGVISIGVGGPAADQVTRSIAGATKSVAVSILTEPPKTGTVQYNRAQFPISGAAGAIKMAYAGCGIKF
jgi:hypothetical protein